METHTCYLMHKDIPVLTFLMNDEGMCCEVYCLYNRTHLPPGMTSSPGVGEVNRFLSGRMLSKKRPDVTRLKNLNLFDPSFFMPFHFVSAFDCYWIKYEGEVTMFEDVSLFRKTSVDTEDMTDVVTYSNYGHDPDIEILRDSPNLTVHFPYPVLVMMTEEKMHVLFEATINDRSLFLKREYAKYIEVLDGNYASYNDAIFYDVEDVADEHTELIFFEGYFNDVKKRPENAGLSDAELLVETIRENDIPGKEDYITSLLTLDDRFGLDRELYEMGVLRDPDTLVFKSFAPVFCFPEERA